MTSSRILCHCRRFSDQSCGVRCLGVRNRATSTWRVRHGVVFLLAYEVPGLSFCNEGWCGINEKCEYQVVARQRKVVFQSFCKRSLSSEGGTTSILLWTALRTPAESRRSGASTPGQRGLGSAPGRNRGTCRGIVALLLRPSHSLLRVRRLTRLLKSEHRR